MSDRTPRSCRNVVLYSVYVRNHGPHGTFADVIRDIPRIRAMGVDYMWLMPIHPIGRIHAKGTRGSPYSIRDYRAVNPEYGNMDDFMRLIAESHAHGLKVILDAIFNHTAHDSDLVRHHIEWFHRGADGGPYRAASGWTDIAGLKHPNPDLSAYLIDTLLYWANTGVDGFRCDVASLLPKKFWIEARRAVDAARPDLLWLAESVSASFVASQRACGLTALSDSELYEAFDITYDYDLWAIWQAAVAGRVPVSRYLEMLRFQDAIYPANYVKLRCVENHDGARIMKAAATRSQALAWTAFSAFNNGAWLIQAGQESGATHTPSLFDVDRIAWGEYELQPFLSRLAALKKDPAQLGGRFVLLAAEPAIQAAWLFGRETLYGIFNIRSHERQADVFLPDGDYQEVLSGERLPVCQGQVRLPAAAAVLRVHHDDGFKPLYSDLLDFVAQ
jgi:hypothetical protein